MQATVPAAASANCLGAAPANASARTRPRKTKRRTPKPIAIKPRPTAPATRSRSPAIIIHNLLSKYIPASGQFSATSVLCDVTSWRRHRQKMVFQGVLNLLQYPPMSNIPPLTALRAFEAAVRLGGFARAAVELNVSTSAVCQQIRNLEGLLGGPLV